MPSTKRKDTEVFKADRTKLFAINEKQIGDHTCMLDMPHSYIYVSYVYLPL